MRFISLFGGIGGFDLALERKGHKCVWYNDIDKYAVKTYNKNFGSEYEPKDITQVRSEEIPKHDLLCAGFPCQSFSIAGKRGGFSDTRGTLFFEIMRIAKHHRTPYLVLENVKGLLSHDNGWTFATILNTLDECGYDAQWQVLNSKFFGVPQNRERVFIIANLRNQPRPKIFPLTQNAKTLPGLHTEQTVANALRARDYKGITSPEYYFEKQEGNLIIQQPKIYDRKGFDSRTKGFRENEESPTLSTKMGTGGNNVPMVMSSQPRCGDPKKGGTGILASSEYAFTVDTQPNIVNGLRRLTPVECERLQGFPDNWTQGVSDTQRYKQLGNSVTVNVVEHIVERWAF